LDQKKKVYKGDPNNNIKSKTTPVFVTTGHCSKKKKHKVGEGRGAKQKMFVKWIDLLHNIQRPALGGAKWFGGGDFGKVPLYVLTANWGW